MTTTLLKPETRTIDIKEPVLLEGGYVLPAVSIQYTTIGKLSPSKDNVIWIFHALTGNSNPLDWWSGTIGADAAFDMEKDYIICANVLGSCYGTTGPEDFEFPVITIRDIVKVHQLLSEKLEIKKVRLGIGGSLGGQQLLEWAVQDPGFFENIIPIATNAVHSPWGIGFNEAQRMALRNSDPAAGLEAARAIAMLSYRHYNTFEKTQKDLDQRWDNFSAANYLDYQGKKLEKRFTHLSYYFLSKAMDSHNVGRNFVSLREALERITARSLVIGINSDILFPLTEQELLQDLIKGAKMETIKSDLGHDAFLLEYDQLNQIIKNFLS